MPNPTSKRLYLVVAACAVTVYLGALWNRFALDDNQIVAFNALVQRISGVWLAFARPYWPVDIGGGLYRPVPVASYAIDSWLAGRAATWWFHAVNVTWHAGVSVAVACLARRWSGTRAGLAAGLLFAVHPVHVEAVANVVGRAELMAALGAVLAVYAALGRDSIAGSAAALGFGLLSKENAIVAPALVAFGWMVGLARPSRRRMAAYGAAWLVVGVLYFTARWAVLHREPLGGPAAVFYGASPIAVRLTATAAFADFTRLLVLPLKLRADYSPAERTLVTTPLDLRFAVGLLCLALWAGLLWLAWRRGRRMEAFGLGWIAIALAPISNLVLPVGVLVAERALYLPSVGLALALGAWLTDLETRRFAWVLGLLVAAGSVRTALRVPVWRDSRSLIRSMLEDSPRSFVGPAQMALLYLTGHQPAKALEAFRVATATYDVVLPWLYVNGAEAAFASGHAPLADSILNRLELTCRPCDFYYRNEAPIARGRGYPAAADSFLARIR
jgi:hypothetical protein